MKLLNLGKYVGGQRINGDVALGKLYLQVFL